MGHDIVLTFREDDPRLSYFKRLSSRAFNMVMHWLSDTPVSSAASDYRLLSRKAVDSLLRLHEKHRFLRGMVNWLGFRTTTVAFYPASRGAGRDEVHAAAHARAGHRRHAVVLPAAAALSFVLGGLLRLLGSGYGAALLGQGLFGA